MSATQPTKEKLMVDALYRKVLRTLARYKAMPFLELMSVCDINAEELEEIIRDLEIEGVVRVVNPDDVTEEIITLKHKGFAVVSAIA